MIRLKTPEEIKVLQEGGKRLASILAELAPQVRPGVSAAELDAKALELARARGDTPAFLGYRPEGVSRAYPSSLCVSVNEEIVHGLPLPEKIFKEGDIVSLDMGLTHEGLITDMAVTVGVGKMSYEAQNVIAATEEALRVGIEAARLGGMTGDIGYAIETYAREVKLSLAQELAGHGVGFAIHEDPFVPNFGKRNTGDVLEAGLVIAIEPMLTLGSGKVDFDEGDQYTVRTADGSRSAHFEKTIAITESGVVDITVV